MVTLLGAVYVEASRIILVAGYDMDEVESTSASLLELNHELTIAYRELGHRNREIKSRKDEIRRLSLTDPLTGLGNRRRLDDALITEVERTQRDDQPLTLVMFDLDHFKAVNDEWGHEMGDLVLKEMGATIRGILRPADIAARRGGEEFVVLLPGTKLEEGVACADRLRQKIEGLKFNFPSSVTASFGVANLQPSEAGLALMERADQALYQAKKEGRNRVMASPM
jgi:diguanylate cyclase (GGDEF)-like protein